MRAQSPARMDQIQTIEAFMREVERAIREKLNAPKRGSGHRMAVFLDGQDAGVLDQNLMGASTYFFSGTRSYELAAKDTGTFQVGFGAIRRLSLANTGWPNPSPQMEPSLLTNATQLAYAPHLWVLNEPRGYVRLDANKEGFGETRFYVTDPNFVVFSRLMQQSHGLRDDEPEPFHLPEGTPPWPTTRDASIELRSGIEDIATCLAAVLKPFSE